MERFLRVKQDEKGTDIALETSITEYSNAKGNKVALIGAVHVGEDSYYKSLTEEFKKYDKLLYELIIADEESLPSAVNMAKIKHAEESGVPEEDEGRSVVHSIQTGLKSLLGLKFQLDEIDYTTKNFVHADMTDAELKEAFQKDKRGVSGLVLDVMLDSYVYEKNHSDPIKDIGFMFRYIAGDNKSRAAETKAYMASQIAKQGGGLQALESSALIGARNDKALSVLDREIKKGGKTFGIFYGAGHFGDMERKLMTRGFKITSSRWLTAWDLK